MDMPIFRYMKCSNQAGPMSRNCKSSKKEGFLPSILCPINCPIQANTNTAIEIYNKGSPACAML